MNKIIAVDIDNVLNNFDETLKNIEFPYDKDHCEWGSVQISETEFMQNLNIIKQQQGAKYYDKTFNAMWNQVHKLAHQYAKVKQGASEFLWYLKENHYRIVIMTRRDLRYTLEYTKDFLEKNELPYDDLFNSNTKVVTCGLWKIPILIDDEFEAIMLSNKLSNPVQVYYPIMDKHKGIEEHPMTAIGYHCFKELKQWIK